MIQTEMIRNKIQQQFHSVTVQFPPKDFQAVFIAQRGRNLVIGDGIR
jgi:hypothetical protein